MHRFDGVFQIIAGAWVNPLNHTFYANGNVLVWNGPLPFRRGDELPDTFGIGWVSGCDARATSRATDCRAERERKECRPRHWCAA